MADQKPPVEKADSDEEVGFVSALKKLVQKHELRDKGGPGGQVRRRKIDEVVDEAVAGAKPDPM